MKLLLCLFLATSLLTGCVKYNSGGCNNETNTTGIKGNWELRSVAGGMTGGGNFSPGNGNIIKFTDTNYEKIRNSQIIDQGTYTLSSGNNPQTGSMMNRINYQGGYYEYYEIVNNQLTLYSGVIAADGTISKYTRQ